jgi:WD40 repeat protein
VTVLKGHADTVDAVAVSPDGHLIATGSFDKTIKLWDTTTGKELLTLAGPQGHQQQVLAVAFSPSGDQLASGGADNAAKVWDAPAGFPARRFTATAAVTGAAVGLDAVGEFLPQSERLARRARFVAPNPVKNLPHPNLVDAIKTIPAHIQTQPQNVPHPIYCVLWAPGGKQVLTASFDRSLKLWDADSGKLVRELKAAPDPKPGDKAEPPKGPVGHRDQVFTAAFTEDGKLLATGSSDKAVKLWDVAAGTVVRDFVNPDLKAPFPGESAPSHPGWVHAVRFTPGGEFLVTAGAAPRYRGYLAVWRIADGERVYAAELETGPIQALETTPDGKRLVLGCGPKGRLESAADAVIVKMPGK